MCCKELYLIPNSPSAPRHGLYGCNFFINYYQIRVIKQNNYYKNRKGEWQMGERIWARGKRVGRHMEVSEKEE